MNYRQLLKKIFDHEAIIVIIKGYWKTGKTNVGLRLIEDLIEIGIISIAGTNIKIQSNEFLKYIEDFPALRRFHYDDPIKPKSKVFVFDEAGKLAVRRGAMRKMNVEFMKFIPELSKGKMKLIVITQSENLTDSIFTETEFTKATITTHKTREFGYSISVMSELLDRPMYFINRFPKTNIQYSPYESAEFFLEPRFLEKRNLLCCVVSRMYAVEGLSSTKIANRLGYSRDKVIRLIKMHIRHTLNSLTPEDIEEIRSGTPKTVFDELNGDNVESKTPV